MNLQGVRTDCLKGEKQEDVRSVPDMAIADKGIA